MIGRAAREADSAIVSTQTEIEAPVPDGQPSADNPPTTHRRQNSRESRVAAH